MPFNLDLPRALPHDRPIRLLQLSDIHLLENQQDLFAGIRPFDSLQAILTHIRQQQAFDCVLTTGDIAQESTPSTYQQYLDAIKTLNFPHFWVKGNHDDHVDASLQSDLNEPSVILLGKWCMILLNSQMDNCIYGMIAEEQLQRLSELLTEYQDYHVILALHHNTFWVGCKWLDLHSLKNAEDFLACITPHQNVKMVLSGHVHQEFNYRHQHIDFLSCPSTCIQFKPLCEEFTLDDLPPGYRLLELSPNGQYVTEVLRLNATIGRIDYSLKEY